MTKHIIKQEKTRNKTENNFKNVIFSESLLERQRFENTFAQQKQKNGKHVFTLPRAHQNQIFHEMFQVLALDVRPK